jgi:transposase-like protein
MKKEIQKAFQIPASLKVNKIEEKEGKTIIHCTAKKKKVECKHCGGKTKFYDWRKSNKRHTVTGGKIIWLKVKKQRVECKECGKVFVVHVDGVGRSELTDHMVQQIQEKAKGRRIDTHTSTKFARTRGVFLCINFSFTMNEHITQQGCPNKSCCNYDRKGAEYVSIHDHKNNRYRCRVCGKTWNAHQNEFCYGLRTNPVKVRRAVDMLRAGIPVRKIARLVDVSAGTVMRWKKKLKKFNS